ncbi:unnamed protein product [Echinostoma caproni]|uniref:Uncharacterized protein n=1 Tax=Echinostoma caproni TaxID=27848 RepID=A0A182ZZK6_9TREM|nr:unnamed protein product [Echinostoma caproni]
MYHSLSDIGNFLPTDASPSTGQSVKPDRQQTNEATSTKRSEPTAQKTPTTKAPSTISYPFKTTFNPRTRLGLFNQRNALNWDPITRKPLPAITTHHMFHRVIQPTNLTGSKQNNTTTNNNSNPTLGNSVPIIRPVMSNHAQVAAFNNMCSVPNSLISLANTMPTTMTLPVTTVAGRSIMHQSTGNIYALGQTLDPAQLSNRSPQHVPRRQASYEPPGNGGDVGGGSQNRPTIKTTGLHLPSL